MKPSKSQHSYRGSTSKYKGVSRSRRSGSWQVFICIGGSTRYVGSFGADEEEAAARAYDTAARKHHGAAGRYNFPRPGEKPAIREEETWPPLLAPSRKV